MKGLRSFLLLVCLCISLAAVMTLGPTQKAFGNFATNSAPLAIDDSYQVHGDTDVGPLLANDSDPDGDPISLSAFITLPQHGLLFNTARSDVFWFHPTFGYTGPDSFSYQICDNHDACATAIVSIQINNTAPSPQNDFYNVHGRTRIGPWLANDSDPDGDSISLNAIPVLCQHCGDLSNTIIPDSFDYTPAFGYTGPDSINYRICDSLGACATAVVSINVTNSAPTPVDKKYSIRGNTNVGPLLFGDTDPEGDAITLNSLVSSPQHGELSNTITTDVFNFRPAAGFSGSDSFVYRECDSLGACSNSTVTLWIIGDGENDGATSCNTHVGEPVNVTNGNMYLQQNDYALPSAGPGISILRTYNSNSQRPGLFGRGWSSEYDESIQTYGNNLTRFNQSDGRAIYLGRAVGSSGVMEPLEEDFHGYLLQNASNGFTVTMTNGSVRQFNAAGKLVSLADRVGNQTALAYDGGGKLASVTDPFGRVLSFITNANGQVLSIGDTLGTIATYTYGGSNQLLSVTYADNSAFQFGYDGNLRLTSVTDALGNVVESHTYDSEGRAITSAKHGGVELYTLSFVSATETDVTDALGRVSKYTFNNSNGRSLVTRVEGLCACGGSAGSQVQTWTYDKQSNVISHTNALGRIATYTYDTNGNRLSGTGVLGGSSFTYNQLGQILTATDAMGGVTTYAYDAVGNLLSVKDALNNITTFTYDARGELLTMTNALGKATALAYDASGNISQLTDALGNITKFAYDARGRMTTTTNALNFITRYAHDPAGRVNKITRPDLSFITFTYDLAGRRSKITDALNNSTTFAYDTAYRLKSQTDALARGITFGYDAMSNLVTTTDALGRSSNYEYDENNRLIKAIYPPAVAGAARLQESVEYDAVGNVTKRIDTAGRATAFTYDNANRVVMVTDAALQTTQYEYNARSNVIAVVDALGQRYTFDYDDLSRPTSATRAGLTMSVSYDAIGNRVRRTDYNNMTASYTYDAVNRLTKVTYPDASLVTYGYDKLSQLTSATNANGTVSFSYDSRGRTISTTDVFGQVLNYAYDANDRRTRLSFGATTNATYTYDAVNQLIKITDSANLAIAYTYDGAGRLISRALPNSIATTYSYDGLNRLTRLKDAKKNTVIADNNYQYNVAGNLSQNVDQSGTHVYGYDPMERLSSATYTGTPNETYTYDAVGNRTNSHKSASYSYQPNNRLVATTAASYLYDNNGNLISKAQNGATQFAWDFESRLTQVVTPSSGSVSYKYDALGRRIQRTASSGTATNFTYDGQDAVKDSNSDGTSVEYLNGPGIDNKIRQKGPSAATTYYFAQDQLGTTTALTNTKGQLVERMAYDGYGNSAGSTRTRYSFTGRERDSLTGLLHYRARSYDPQLGRFISEDPIGLTGGINQFAYVANNPQNAKDPSGLFEIDVHYYLTYYLALKTGCFSDADARLIAEGDWDSDESDWKKPGWGNSIVVINGNPTIFPDLAQRARNVAFHSFGTPAENAARAAELLSQARAHGGNPFLFGTYLHFLQDSFSHENFAGNDTHGHLAALHHVDHTSTDRDKSKAMAHATFGALRDFGRRKGCGCTGAPDWK
ncbi:MAG TPA: Ig-like domain-containing protein, partial [Pyrinomonadaceae bacterium]|nr:Ig-like domain-containing protein [Pyrinomonadaceae bacterium]